MDKEIYVSDVVDVYLEPWLRELVGDRDMPARKIRPSRYSVTGYVPSSKGTKAQDAESSLEQDFLTLLEYDKRVERYVAQPFSIMWTDASGKRHRYTPDVIVKYSYSAMRDDPYLRTTIFEIKPSRVLARDWQELKPRLRSALGWAKEYGCRFHLVTEKEIRTPYLTNVRFLLGYYNKHLPERNDLVAERQHLVIETLRKLKRTTPRELLHAITHDEQLQAEMIPWMWNLLNMEFIGADLTKPLTMVSPIWATEKTKHFL
jgi:hypothetical protein